MNFNLSVLVLFTALAIALQLYACRFKQLRYPVIIYSGIYAFTVVVGAYIIALNTKQLQLDILASYCLSAVLTHRFGFIYWFELLLPFFIPIAMAVIFVRMVGKFKNFDFNLQFADISKSVFISVFFVFALSIVIKVLFIYINMDYIQIQTMPSYDKFVFIRKILIDNMGTVSFAFIYRILPTLSYVAFYYAIKLRSMLWFLIFALAFLTVCGLSIAVAQKAPLIIYLLMLVVGLAILKKISIFKLFLLLASLALLFVGYELVLIHNPEVFSILGLLIFRMAVGYPFYIAVFPAVIPFGQVNFGLDLIGLAQSNHITLTMYQLICATPSWGDIPAPAHVMAYALGGLPYSVLIMLLSGIALIMICSIKNYASNAISFSLYLSCLTFLYFLTQASFEDTLISSYGIIWAFLAIAILVAARKLAVFSTKLSKT